jgi:hypothetical protein
MLLTRLRGRPRCRSASAWASAHPCGPIMRTSGAWSRCMMMTRWTWVHAAVARATWFVWGCVGLCGAVWGSMGVWDQHMALELRGFGLSLYVCGSVVSYHKAPNSRAHLACVRSVKLSAAQQDRWCPRQRQDYSHRRMLCCCCRCVGSLGGQCVVAAQLMLCCCRGC